MLPKFVAKVMRDKEKVGKHQSNLLNNSALIAKMLENDSGVSFSIGV